MLGSAQLLTIKSSVEPKCDRASNDGITQSKDSFQKVLKDVKDSILPKPESSLEEGKEHIHSNDEDEGNINQTFYQMGFHWVSNVPHHVLQNDSALDGGEIDLDHSVDGLNFSDEQGHQLLDHDLNIDLLQTVLIEEESLLQDYQVIDSLSERPGDLVGQIENYYENGLDDSLYNELDVYPEKSIDDISHNLFVESSNNVNRLEYGFRIPIEELDHQRHMVYRDQTNIPYNSEGQVSINTFDDMNVSQIKIHQGKSSNADNNGTEHSFSSEEEVQSYDGTPSNDLVLLSIDTKDVHLDISKILNRQDPVHQIHVIEDLANRTANALRGNTTELELQIKPEHLGKLVVKLMLDNGSLTGNIYAESELVKDLLHSNLDNLKDALKHLGFSFTTLDVDVGSQPNQQSFHHSQRIKPKYGRIISSKVLMEIQSGMNTSSDTPITQESLVRINCLA